MNDSATETTDAQIVPSDDTPGAREAGVIYFIDRALATFLARLATDADHRRCRLHLRPWAGSGRRARPTVPVWTSKRRNSLPVSRSWPVMKHPPGGE